MVDRILTVLCVGLLASFLAAQDSGAGRLSWQRVARLDVNEPYRLDESESHTAAIAGFSGDESALLVVDRLCLRVIDTSTGRVRVVDKAQQGRRQVAIGAWPCSVPTHVRVLCVTDDQSTPTFFDIDTATASEVRGSSDLSVPGQAVGKSIVILMRQVDHRYGVFQRMHEDDPLSSGGPLYAFDVRDLSWAMTPLVPELGSWGYQYDGRRMAYIVGRGRDRAIHVDSMNQEDAHVARIQGVTQLAWVGRDLYCGGDGLWRLVQGAAPQEDVLYDKCLGLHTTADVKRLFVTTADALLELALPDARICSRWDYDGAPEKCVVGPGGKVAAALRRGSIEVAKQAGK